MGNHYEQYGEMVLVSKIRKRKLEIAYEALEAIAKGETHSPGDRAYQAMQEIEQCGPDSVLERGLWCDEVDNPPKKPINCS